MTQNTSHAVMAQRSEPHDSLDFFPTPAWATRALCSWLEGNIGSLGQMIAWEPACGQGHMTIPLREYFAGVVASDVHSYGFGDVHDFLFPPSIIPNADWIISNPPFNLGEQFITAAIARATKGVAMLVRTAFLESADRYQKLFSVTPPTDILQFVERVPMFKGRIDRAGSTATAYCWLVWQKPFEIGDMVRGQIIEDVTLFHWLPPCRKRLERDEDYPVAAE